MRKYVRGGKAVGICQRCSKKMLRKDMVEDGYYPSMIVCPDCFDSRHPQERLPKLDDPVTLYKPAPDDVGTPPALSGENVGTTATLTWTEAVPINARIASYDLYRRVLGEVDWALSASLPITYDIFMAIIDQDLEYQDTGLAPNTLYEYFVEATTEPEGPDPLSSNIVQVGTQDGVFEPPSAPVLSVDGDEAAGLSWTASVPDAGDTITGYAIYRSISGGAFALLTSVAGDVLDYEDAAISSGIFYGYYVVAEAEEGGNSAASNEVEFIFDEDPDLDDTYMLLHVENGQLYERIGFPNVAVVGAGVVSTVQEKFGTQSFSNPGSALFSTNYISVIGAPTNFVFPGEFTFEGWFYYRGSHDTYNNIFTNNINFPTAGFLQLAIRSSGRLFWNSSPGTNYTSTINVALNQWQHLAVTRDASNQLRFFVNGVLAGGGVLNGTIGGASAGVSTFDVGRGIASDNSDLDAFLEEVRVTKRCRYTATFTPPTAPFPPFP